MPKILSFHLLIETGWNRVLAGGLPGRADIRAMARADAVILPQGCRQELYRLATKHCRHVFPDYEARFRYPGKTGQALLFAEYGAACPEQFVLQDISDYSSENLPFAYPFVVKGALGGEGNNVLLIKNREEFDLSMDKVSVWLEQGGCLVQQYVPAGGKSLRVVAIGESFYPYWRINWRGGFYSNLAKGAEIYRSGSFRSLEDRAVEALRPFCRATGINLAGFDFLFSMREVEPRPLFLEVNYCFRTRGLGGPDLFLGLLEKGVRQWSIDRFGKPPD